MSRPATPKNLTRVQAFYYLMQGGKCFYCGEDLALTGATADHFWPKSRYKCKPGAKVIACRDCNQKKDDREPTFEEYARFYLMRQTARRAMPEFEGLFA